MSAIPSDKNEPIRITGSWRHEQREVTCSTLLYSTAEQSLFCKAHHPVSFVRWASFRSRARIAIFVRLARHLDLVQSLLRAWGKGDGSSSGAKCLHSMNYPSGLTPGFKKQKENSNKRTGSESWVRKMLFELNSAWSTREIVDDSVAN